MLRLTKEEKEMLRKIVEEMMEDCAILRGKYDAKNGSQDFMFGVALVMDYLSYSVSDDFGAKNEIIFIRNMTKSINKVKNEI